LAREMLRLMLKAWLDENLPGIVERLVRRDAKAALPTRQSRSIQDASQSRAAR
jgi:cell pole-organizing protein PopZ